MAMGGNDIETASDNGHAAVRPATLARNASRQLKLWQCNARIRRSNMLPEEEDRVSWLASTTLLNFGPTPWLLFATPCDSGANGLPHGDPPVHQDDPRFVATVTVMHMSDKQQHERKACTLNTLLGIFERIASERGKAAVPAADVQTTEDAATWQVAESVYRM